MFNLPEPTLAEKLYCLKLGKHAYQHVDQAEQTISEDTDDPKKNEFLRCTKCRHPISRKTDRIAINEQHQHVFANPHGYIYQIGCFAQAPGCVTSGEASSHFSWFPGYTWQFALCSQCLTLLGWAFRSQGSLFFGLIVDRLTETS